MKKEFSFLNSFKDQRVVITGDTGFKGSWLALWLKSIGAEILGIGLPPPKEKNSLYNKLGLQDCYDHSNIDIRDGDALKKSIVAFKPTFLFHLAAQPLVRESYEKPKETFDINVGGTVNVLEAVRTCPSLKSVIVTSTDKCYRNRNWVWGYRETDELGGSDPYSASKAAAEIVFDSYMQSYFSGPEIGIATVRAGNVIGGGDWAANRIVPDCINALATNQPIVVRNPAAIRPFQHVLDALYGYMLLASKLEGGSGKFNGSWNFGPSAVQGQTVSALAEGLVKSWGHGSIEIKPDQHQAKEAHALKLSNDKAVEFLGWKPIWNFERTILETANWYKAESEGVDAYKICLEQISAFIE